MAKEVKIQTTVSFQNLLEAKHRVSHHVGGTRSGKTYAILQYLIAKGIESPIDISIVRKTIPSLKKTVMKDFKDIMISLDLWVDESMNVADRVYKLYNGTIFQFINTDDEQKLRGLKSTILYIDEANEVTEDQYFQLSIRTEGQIILS
jgi:phage terminase large subunit